MRARRGIIVLATVLAIVLMGTGCLRTDVAVRVNDDRTGTVDLDVYFANATLDAAGITGDELLKIAEAATKNFEGAEVSSLSTADAKGIRLSQPYDSVEQLSAALTNSNLQGQSVRAFSAFTVTEGTDGNWSFKATVDPVGLDALFASLPSTLPLQGLDLTSAEIAFTVELPGTVARTNAERKDGGAGTWKLTSASTSTELFMENEPTELSPLQMLLIGVGILFVVGFLLILFTAAGSKRLSRRRGRRVDVVERPGSWSPPAHSVLSDVAGGRDEHDLPPLGGSTPSGSGAASGAEWIPPVGLVPLGGVVAVPPHVAPHEGAYDGASAPGMPLVPPVGPVPPVLPTIPPPVPVVPAPAPVEPAPVEPAPVQPAPVQPAPVQSVPPVPPAIPPSVPPSPMTPPPFPHQSPVNPPPSDAPGTDA